MDLIGIPVVHNAWGQGKIIRFDGKIIEVEFPVGNKRFVYPDAFEKFIKAEDADVQAAIIKEIIDTKAAAVQKRLAEEAARRVAVEERNTTTITLTASKKSKSFDEMFSPDYHAEKLARQPILTYQQVEERFGIRITEFGRGINLTENTVVLISSIGKAKGTFVYHDKWTEDGDYLYSGEGKSGDQAMTKGNLAIRDAACNGKKIHLFVKFSPKEYYYQGVFYLVNYTYEDEKDEDGNIRKEYKFQLRKVVTE